MKTLLFTMFAMLFLSAPKLAQSSEFIKPWEDTTKALVIDPYQGNSIDWDKLAANKRVAAIIHRATIGSRTDTKYADRKIEAEKRGYLWGSYHLGKPGDPVRQADFYLKTVGNSDDEVLALDIESLNEQMDMSLTNARRFIERIKEKTGRYPMIYGNQAVIREIGHKYGKDTVFAKTPLWYARFIKSISDFPKQTWNTYTFWQFSSEINCQPTNLNACLYLVSGTKSDMDVNVYNGSIEDLKRNWSSINKSR